MQKVKSGFEIFLTYIIENKFLFLFFLVIFSSTVYYFKMVDGKNETLRQYVVSRVNLEEAVTLTGTVKPSEEANMTFEKTGTVNSLKVEVGQKVNKGDVLATLSSSDDSAKVLEANATLEAQIALLEDLQTGAKAETVDNKRAALAKSKTDVDQAYRNAMDSVRNVSISGNTFVRDNLATLFTGNINNGYTINSLVSCDAFSENKVNQLRSDAEKSLFEIEKLSNTQTISIEELVQIRTVHMKVISDYFNALKDLFSNPCSTSNPTYDSYRTLITSSRNTWQTLSTDLSSKTNTIDNLKILVTQAENDLTLVQNGEKSQKVRQQEAQVKAARARLAQAVSNSEKNQLVAPFPGVITNIELKVGELVNPGGKGVSIISDSNYEIESKVSEVDVAKLSVGASTSVSFDAYGEDVLFKAQVLNISPAGIISEGVPTYKTIFSFIDSDPRIKSGMTANLKVITKVNQDVLAIPAKYISQENNVKLVKVEVGSKVVTREVRVGARGMDGMVEIVSGLNEGQVLVEQK